MKWYIFSHSLHFKRFFCFHLFMNGTPFVFCMDNKLPERMVHNICHFFHDLKSWGSGRLTKLSLNKDEFTNFY